MRREISEDIMGYKKDFFKGLSLKECAILAGAFASGVIVFLLLIQIGGVAIDVATQSSVFASVLVAALALVPRKSSISMFQYIRYTVQFRNKKPLVYATQTKFKSASAEKKAGLIEQLLKKINEKR